MGLFASDKPDGDALNASGLTPAGEALLERARAAYRAKYHNEMSAAALAGFSGAWALFHTVMPAASEMTPKALATAALRARIPPGGLPNGGGLLFGAPGTIDPGGNLRAASVIWEWLGVNQRAVGVARTIRHQEDRSDLDRSVSESRRALVVGLSVVAAYLVLAAVSGKLTPLARGPLLDGFAPPPPYNFVSPPPDLASTNKRPAAGKFTISLDPIAGSEPKVVATTDFQASIALAQGAIAPHAGDSSASLAITPMAPGSSVALPSGLQMAGNVYRFTATYRPSGDPVTRLRQDAQLVLAYPLRAHTLAFRHTLLRSPDGRSFTAVSTTDSIAQQLVQGNVQELGYFAVAQSSTGTPTPSSSVGHIVYTVVLWALLGLIVVAFLVAELRRRRKRHRSPTPRPPRRPPPKRDRGRRLDPWE